MGDRATKTAFIKEFVCQLFENQYFGIIFDYCNSKSNKNDKIIEFMENYGLLLLDTYFKKELVENDKYLDLDEVKKSLNYKDLRSVAQWCKKNGVFIIEQGKRHLVSKVEFLTSFHKPLMEHLKTSFTGEKSKHSRSGVSKKTASTNKYKPTTETEKSFLSTLKNL